MNLRTTFAAIALSSPALLAACAATLAQAPDKPLPDPRQLMRDVVDHQKQVDKVRENYTYTSDLTTQDLDSAGKVTKTESLEIENFFVNGHGIGRVVKKNGKPLSDSELQKQAQAITKTVEKAEKTPPGQSIDGGETISISRILDIMDVGAPRREMFRGRPTIVFDFAGRKDAKTHGLAENASKKLKGTIWIDEADREVAHLEVTFVDNFHVGGGLIANIQKGSKFQFDQAPVDGALWLPTSAEGTIAARVLLFKGMRQHFQERDSQYKHFSVEAQQEKAAQVVGGKP